ncbi:MAG: diguanylate cyclase, partial [Planctomycetota bacterium]
PGHLRRRVKSFQRTSDELNDAVARLGGDEYAVFAKFSTREDAIEFGDRIREEVLKNQMRISSTKESIGEITFSIGGAFLRETDDPVSWYKRSDEMMYRAKELGGNRIVVEPKTLQ